MQSANIIIHTIKFLTALFFLQIPVRLSAQTVHENATILEDKILVPNAFSPNGDNLNDVFKIFAKNDVLIASFIIINQHGEIVFQTMNETDSWDGRYKGISAPEGSYMYMVSFIVAGELGIQSKKGSIILIR